MQQFLNSIENKEKELNYILCSRTYDKLYNSSDHIKFHPVHPLVVKKSKVSLHHKHSKIEGFFHNKTILINIYPFSYIL